MLAHPRDYLPRFAQHYHRLRALPRQLRRSLQRQWKQSLAGIALLMTLGSTPALAATINVAPGAPPGINADTLCSLIEAIDNANATTPTPIHGDCTAGNDSGADLIVLPPNSLQTLTTVNNVSHGPNGLPVIFSDITINGQGSTISRNSSAPAFRIFEVYTSYSGTGALTLQQTTISGGTMAGSSGLASFGGGIGLFQQYGYGDVFLVLSSSTITGNSARIGGGIGSYADGGSARVSMTNSTVSNNFGPYGGGLGFISTRFGFTTTSITGSTFAGNHASLGGGAFFSRAGVNISNSTFSGNSGGEGGAVFNSRGPLNLTESTVTGNTASVNGGGITNAVGGYNLGPGRTALTSSIVSGNTSPSGPEIFNGVSSYYSSAYYGRVTTTGSNILGQNGNPGVMNNFTLAANDIVPSGPVSSVLNTTRANNGGLTLTHNLTVGGPAADAAGATCSATDQRGVVRPRDAACDIGAVEVVICNGLAARVGTAGNDVITGTAGIDVIDGLAGNDTINGLGGNDHLCGGNGNDTLNGGFGNDALIGGTGTDRARFPGATAVTVDLSSSSATGQGSDTLTDIENLTGSDGNDWLTGNAGPNQLTGGNGNDVLFGMAGIDNLNGGAGFDLCFGGPPRPGDSATPDCDLSFGVGNL